MGYNITFKEDISYSDPEFHSIYVTISGEYVVSSASDSNEQRVTDLAKMAVQNALYNAVDSILPEGLSYKDLPSRSSVMEENIRKKLEDDGLICESVRVTEIVPSERSAGYIEQISKLKEAAAMSPEERAKKAEEAQKAAMETLAKLSPEERKKVDEEAAKMMQEFEAKQKATMESVQQILAGRKPKFCPNCGTPVEGAKFCPNCGNKL